MDLFESKARQFVRGVGFCVAHLARRDEPTLAIELASQGGYGVKDFVEAECDDFDLIQIKLLYKQESKQAPEEKK